MQAFFSQIVKLSDCGLSNTSTTTRGLKRQQAAARQTVSPARQQFILTFSAELHSA